MTENSANQTDKPMKWLMAFVIGVLVILGMIWFWAHIKAHSDYLIEVSCRRAKQDANHIAAAIADYFADPEHITLPTIDGESEYLGYTLNSRDGQNIAWVTGDPESTIIIVVQDGSGKCPDDYQEQFPEWESGKYTKIMD